MMFRYATNDPDAVDNRHPMGTHEISLEIGGDRIFGVMFTPQGKGPHPTILLLHGFPGYEQNLDLMQVLRRAGFNVMTFHYRGCWGSEGKYSFANVLEDVDKITSILTENDARLQWDVDPERVMLMGHSMGGFAALMTAANHPEIRQVVSLAGWNLGAVGRVLSSGGRDREKAIAMFEQCAIPLKGTDAETLMEEAIRNADNWDLVSTAPHLDHKDVLLVTGLRDDISPSPIHHAPLKNALEKRTDIRLSEKTLDDGHAFDCCRITLAEGILHWLNEIGIMPSKS